MKPPPPQEDKPDIQSATGEPYGLPGQLEQAFEQIGSTMMSDIFCAKLLAYVGVLGPEVCVLHKGLNAGIQIAQQKANLYGAHVPNPQMLPLIKKYMAEVEKDREKTTWIQEIYDRYQLFSGSGVRPQHRDRRPKPKEDGETAE